MHHVTALRRAATSGRGSARGHFWSPVMTESLWIHYARPRPHWYAIGESEQAARRKIWADVAGVSREAGGVFLGAYHVRGQHDFETVEIWRFPDAEPAFDHWPRLPPPP